MEVNDTKQARIRLLELAQAFVAGPDRRLSLAGQIEDLLQSVFPDDPDLQDLVVALACYRPEGGPHLYNASEMAELLKKISATVGPWSFVGWVYSPTIFDSRWASTPTLQLKNQRSDLRCKQHRRSGKARAF